MYSMQRFDALTHNLRECVLDMGSFSKDQKIIASTIIDVWSELHGKENIICMNYVQELASHNLLKLLPLGYVTFYSSVDSLSCYFSLFLIQESCEPSPESPKSEITTCNISFIPTANLIGHFWHNRKFLAQWLYPKLCLLGNIWKQSKRNLIWHPKT